MQLLQRYGPRRCSADLRGRQERIGGLARIDQLVRADEIGEGIDLTDAKLSGGVLVGPGRAVGKDDPLRQEIRHALAMLRHVGAVHVVEGSVLADEKNDVLDRGRGVELRMLSRVGRRDSNLTAEHRR